MEKAKMGFDEQAVNPVDIHPKRPVILRTHSDGSKTFHDSCPGRIEIKTYESVLWDTINNYMNRIDQIVDAFGDDFTDSDYKDPLQIVINKVKEHFEELCGVIERDIGEIKIIDSGHGYGFHRPHELIMATMEK